MMTHTMQPLPVPSKAEIKEMMKGKLVVAPDEIILNISGAEDMLPCNTRVFKADRPMSDTYKKWNENMYLPTFERRAHHHKRSNPAMLQSEDMYYAMLGNEDGRRRLEIDRMGRDLLQEETGYGPNWVALAIAKKEDLAERPQACIKEQRAKSARVKNSGSSAVGSQGRPMSARGAAEGFAKLEDNEGPPLRWPSHMAMSRGGKPQSTDAFRTPNGVCDWAGLSGLGIWSRVAGGKTGGQSPRRSSSQPPSPSRARSPAASVATNPRRAKTPDASARPKTSNAVGWASPRLGYSASAAPSVASARPQTANAVGWASPRGGASDATQPRAALDTTRPKGVEFPSSPQAKSARSPAPSNRGGTAKQVWSRPADTMKLASPAVDTANFAL